MPSSRPIVPPRFDNFCEQIVGTWNPSKNSRSCITTTSRQVEEVMRSCGGAVQGVREQNILVSNSDDTLESMYLNRADDGFVYFDCGTYAKCPTQLPPEDDTISDEDSMAALLPIVASISFSTQPKSRLFFDVTTNSCTAFMKSSSLTKQDSEPANDIAAGETQFNLQDVKWGKETICRMEHGNQPWVLQRAKWQASNDLNSNHLLQSKCNSNADEIQLSGRMQSWDMTRCDASESASNTNSSKTNVVSGHLPHKTPNIIEMGGRCINSGEVKSLYIYYDDKGSLHAIVLKEGLYN
jgi:hypothetical protein